VAKLIEGWRSAPDGFSHQLFDDAAARHFLAKEHHPSVLAAYDATAHAAGKSDLFRIAWLASHGGVYIDADDRRVGPLSRLLPIEAGFVVNRSPGPPPCINNWFIATRPDHPLLWELLRGAVRNIQVAAASRLTLPPWNVTGPGLFSTTIMDEFVIAGSPSDTLCDFVLHTERQYREVAVSVVDLDYRSDKQSNWKLAFAQSRN
jgi:mannosyltransferase OCH1-like enzyme